MAIDTEQFRVRERRRIRLGNWSTRVDDLYDNKEDYKADLTRQVARLSELQNVLYADDRYALLVVFQAMDAAGKDGVIKHVMSGINPQGCQVFSFKHPSAQELDHDFLWRSTLCLPERGRIGIFNRSYYEEVLIVRVHPEILSAQRLPDRPRTAKKLWKRRYKSIVDFECHLHRNGTRVVKFFLHVSKEEQRQRFLARLDDPAKNWKFSEGDLAERALWDDYMSAYEACLEATSTDEAPWFVVPADDKENARLIVAEVLVETLSRLKLRYPAPDTERVKQLQSIRRRLAREAGE